VTLYDVSIVFVSGVVSADESELLIERKKKKKKV